MPKQRNANNSGPRTDPWGTPHSSWTINSRESRAEEGAPSFRAAFSASHLLTALPDKRSLDFLQLRVVGSHMAIDSISGNRSAADERFRRLNPVRVLKTAAAGLGAHASRNGPLGVKKYRAVAYKSTSASEKNGKMYLFEQPIYPLHYTTFG